NCYHSFGRRHKYLPAGCHGRSEISARRVDAATIDHLLGLRIHASDNSPSRNHVDPAAILEWRGYFGNAARLRPLERSRRESALSGGPDGKQAGRNLGGATRPELTYGVVFCFIDETILVAVNVAEEKLYIEMRSRDVIGHTDALAEKQVIRGRFGFAELS